MEIPHGKSYTKSKENVKSLLEDLNNHELTKRVEAIKKLGNLLCEDPQTRDYFYKLEGKNAILNRLFVEEKRKFVETALFTLANSTINHTGNQNSLINEHIFDLLKTILQQSNIMELRNFSHGTIYLISTIVYQNSTGQHFVRESGCLNQLLNLFHQVLSTAWEIQNPDKELKNLDIICHALYLSVNNPKNEENQKQVAVVFPKVLLYMSFLIFDDKMNNNRLLPCLRLFTGTLSGNKVTQEIFIEYGGMVFLRRLLLDKVNILEEESIEMSIILMDLLISSKSLPSSELPSPSIITFLVNVLQRHKCKLVTLFLLFHLMENDLKMQQVFLKCDGPEKMKQICLKEEDNEEIYLISNGIWAIILKSNQELSKHYVSSRSSKVDEDLPEDEIKINREGSEENSCKITSPKSSEISSIHTFDMMKSFDQRLPKTYRKTCRSTKSYLIHKNKSSVSSHRKNIAVGIKSELDVNQAKRVSPTVHIKKGIERKQESPYVASEIAEGIRDDYDDTQILNLSSVNDIKAGIERKQESPCVASETGERMSDDLDDIPILNLSAVDDIKAGLKSRLEIPCVASEIDERMRDDAIQTKNLSSVDNIEASNKRRFEIHCSASEKGKRMRADPDAIQITNLAPVGNITVSIKRKLEIPCEDLEIVEDIKDEIQVQQTLKVSPSSSMFGTNRKKVTPGRDLEVDRITGNACIENDCRPIAPLNGLIVTPCRNNWNYSYRYTDQLPSEYKSSNILTSGLHNIPLQVSSFARDMDVEILKTPIGIQINLLSNRSNNFCNTVKRRRIYGSKSQISHDKLLANDSNYHYAIQDEAAVLSEKVKASKIYELDIVDYKSNNTEISKPEVIKSESQDSDDDSVVILSHKRKVNGYEILECKEQYDSSSGKNIKMGKKCILNIPAYENMEKKGREVKNGIFCPIISLASQEMNSEIGYWDESKSTTQDRVSEHLIEGKERLDDFKLKNTADDIETSKISPDLAKERSSNFRKELMIPRGQKQRWRSQKGSLPQIPFTRQEIENLNAGIEEFGLNFIDIRKNYSFLSTRTSRDLFVAWRDGLPKEYQGNKNMVRLSSDDCYSSDE